MVKCIYFFVVEYVAVKMGFLWWCCLAKKTTVVLDDDVYVMLVNISIRKYGSAQHISKVMWQLNFCGLDL